MAYYNIYNLQTSVDVFTCESYSFKKRSDYEKKIQKLYRPGHFKESIKIEKYKVTKEFVNEDEVSGDHRVTFIAKNTSNTESSSLLTRSGTRIWDIVYLMRFITGTCVCLKEETKLFLPRYDMDPLICEKYRTMHNQLYSALNTMVKHLTPDIVNLWDLDVVFPYYFGHVRSSFIEQKIGDISTCFEILSQNYYRQNKQSLKGQNESLFLKELKGFVKQSRLSSEQINRLLKTKITASLFDKSIPEKHCDFMLTLPWSKEIDNNKVMEFAQSIHKARNLETHNGKVVLDLKAFKRIPKGLDDETKHNAKLDYVIIQTDVLKLIIKYFIAELLGYHNGYYDLQEKTRITEFITSGTLRGWDPLSGVSWEDFRRIQ